MKRIAIFAVLCLAICIALTGCKGGQTTSGGTAQHTGSVSTGETTASAVDPAPEGQSGSAAGQPADASAAEPSSGTTAEGSAADPSAEAASSGKGAAGDPAEAGTSAAAKAGTQSTEKAGTTKPSAGKGTTAAAKTTAAGKTTTAPHAGTTKASATKPAGTSASSPAGKPSVGTTKMPDLTTTKASAQTGDISGKLRYLNDSAYLSSMDAESLKGFGISGDKQKEILKHKDDWTTYTIQIDFRNNTDKPVTIYYLDVTDNGKGNVYVCGDTAGELGIAANGTMSEKFMVLAPKDVADIEVLDQLSRMSMRVQYAETPKDDMITPNFQYSKIG